MKVTFSAIAKADLLDIAIYIAADNPTRALTFVDELESKCVKLGNAPGIGTARPELGEGIRVMPHENYVVFYCEKRQIIRIERVLHGARDIRANDFESTERPFGE